MKPTITTPIIVSNRVICLLYATERSLSSRLLCSLSIPALYNTPHNQEYKGNEHTKENETIQHFNRKNERLILQRGIKVKRAKDECAPLCFCRVTLPTVVLCQGIITVPNRLRIVAVDTLGRVKPL